MSYTIAGRKILNEHIALAVFGTYGAIAASQMGGSKDAKVASGSPDAKVNDPPINASSSDEEAFIKQFLAEAEGKGSDRLV
ncbi:uncharacterized protein MEPE_04041 [Melanopsichium pennsylvanicum]|uniref:Uncharacterized protein n=2 Tax=Melanopsichium pennsylvanicum TaxID=63383 RepID=A0AAJ4XP45_9BASI|nr:conserved hypothetical protein [Melanopsichium pennsylvanicum 4]SNX85332.1 uncharacterized protein MEPE_04041 [Melanopsichium pennsylvanicum]